MIWNKLSPHLIAQLYKSNICVIYVSITCPLSNGAPTKPTLRPLTDCTAGRLGEKVGNPRYKVEQAWW